jgi:hypothetical protein
VGDQRQICETCFKRRASLDGVKRVHFKRIGILEKIGFVDVLQKENRL